MGRSIFPFGIGDGNGILVEYYIMRHLLAELSSPMLHNAPRFKIGQYSHDTAKISDFGLRCVLEIGSSSELTSIKGRTGGWHPRLFAMDRIPARPLSTALILCCGSY
ncbi:hypothetical protein PsorP6_001177 [Peronosclerospora sorghi]|uniref:Uncharacterized protein n=1 Tax=Peronosclerospora sorghi TaxID=230839 RepID=A0ACC0WXS5_9STRA|nr:hypothetical protein PsorP6_001177 [Peronosclerospora sorghi]